MKVPKFVPKTLRLLLLLSLLFFAFMLYTVLKIRETPSVIIPATSDLKKTSLYGHVAVLSSGIGSRSVYENGQLNAAKEYIFTCLKKMGHSPELQTYTYNGRSFSNIVVTIAGKEHAKETVLIGSHYDTYAASPGADDNASGVALLLELCRFMKSDPLRRTIQFVFFTLEEPPVFRSEFMGSAVYAKRAREKGQNIVAMLCLDMVGYYSDRKGEQGFLLPFMSFFYPTTPNFLAIVGNLSSRRLTNYVAESMRKTPGLAVETLSMVGLFPGLDFSDHRSFWKQGYPAVMITDTAFFRNPNYHGDTDTIKTLDFKRMDILLGALIRTTRDLANKD